MNKSSGFFYSSHFDKQHLNLISVLKEIPHDNVYLVGGTVRDILIGKNPVDIDIVVSDDVEVFSKTLARNIRGVLFVLDKDRGIFRIVSKRGAGSSHYDISPVRGGNIYNDLSLRDFTVDAIATPLTDTNTIIDPYNGKEDIKRRCIRVISENSFDDDPLRLLRAFRLSAMLNFGIDELTLDIIKTKAELLRHSAGERIRGELFRVLSLCEATPHLRIMYDAGLLKEIFTGLSSTELSLGLDVFERLEKFYGSLADMFPDCHRAIENYLSSGLEEGITKGGLLKWLSVYFTNNVTNESLKEALNGLRFGRKARKLSLLGLSCVNRFILNRISGDEEINHNKELYNFYKYTGYDGIGVILCQLAAFTLSQDITDVSLKNADNAISWYMTDYMDLQRNRVVSGDDIKELFHIPPGPAVRQLLDIVEEKIAEGVLSTRDDVFTFLKKLATNI